MLELFIGLMVLAILTDALKDSYYWWKLYGVANNISKPKLVSEGTWHSIKYLSQMSFLVGGYILSVASDSLLYAGYYAVMMAPVLLSLWETMYRYSRFGKFSITHQEELHFPFIEKRITIKGVKLALVHLLLWTATVIMYMYKPISGV